MYFVGTRLNMCTH